METKRIQYVTGIQDNDVKGETGVGTIFYVDVTLGDTVTRKTWSLFDVLNSKFNLNQYLKEYNEHI